MLQNELLLASEAAKTSQRADLEDHIKTAQNSFTTLYILNYDVLYDTLQNELLMASEAEKTSQRADLEDHIKTAQNS